MTGGTGREAVPAAEALAKSLLARVDELAGTLVGVINEQNPGYRLLNVVPGEDLRKSCHDNLERVLQLVGHGGELAPAEAARHYDAARATGERRARQRLPLDDVLRSFRLGGRLVWQALIDQARAEGVADTGDLLDVATRVWEVVDATSAQVAAAYHAAEQALVRADEQRRAALWEGLLQGRGSDAAFAHEASRIIRVPVEGPYVAVAASGQAFTGDLTEALGHRLDSLGLASAWQVRADVLAGLVAVPSGGPAGLAEALAALVTGPVGVSLIVNGLAEVHTAHRQAVLAMRTVPNGETAVVRLADRLPEALLLSSPELTGSLVAKWLGTLLELPADERRLLLDTLATWVGAGGSATRAARLLHCHRNTVLNRMRRIEALTGYPVAGGEIPLELALVVRALPFVPARRVP
ncbi:helix-turn-helix domain-containing protein [Amycolatopsis ultiminotia]|uniref:Helix-turn-helix domain-containing protein n=1 Tax=Amycolatopsis ultiminotia TaxID=543629 RepID=A0ABP6XE00_9PSEU